MHRRPKSTMIYTTTTSILLLSTVANTVSIAAGLEGQQQYQNRRQTALPQHRIISTKRAVPYPVNHPLGRHLREDYDIDILDDEDYNSGNNIVGSDGSRYRQQQIKEQQQTPISNRFLRFFNAPSSKPNTKKRRRDTSNSRIEPTSIQQGTFIEPSTSTNDQDTTTIQYYTITGTSLSNSATQTHLDHLTNADQTKYDDEDYKDGIPYKVLEPHGWRASYAEENKDGNDENLEDLLLQDKEPSLYPPQPTTDNEEIPIQADSLHQTPSSEQQSIYQPIRIRAILTTDKSSGGQYLTTTQRQILLEDIINPALFSWSSALHIIPVGGGYRGRRRTTAEGTDETEENVDEGTEGSDESESQHSNLIIDSSQLYDNQSCGPGLDSGLPSVKVPNEHMTIGLENTDTVIYVSVSFTNDKESSVVEEPPTVRGEYEGSWQSLENEEDLFGTLYHLHNGATGPEYRGRTRRRGNETISSVDEFVNNSTEYPSMSPSYSPSSPPSESEPFIESRPTCTGSYLASSTYCNTDQYDRPIAGMIHICIPSNNVHNFFHDANHVKRNIVTVQHELGHILGMNFDSLGKFRNPDTGLPLTERDEEGNVPITEGVECTGTVSASSPASNLLGNNSVQPRLQANTPIPSTDILKFMTVRGGVRVATIVTPTVQRIVRNMFNCRTLKGAELESGVSQLFSVTDVEDLSAGNIILSAGECIGDHWSRRLFRTDLMNSIVDDVPYTLHISSLTLAYMVDTGWYKVDTNRIASPSIWGRNAGCNFVNKKCLTGRGQVTASNNPFFCNNFLEQVVEPVEDEKKENPKMDYYKKEEEVEEEEEAQIHGCSLDSSRKATCSLIEYDSTIIPDEYNYFQGDKNLDHTYSYGGSDPTLDYCPVFEGYVNGKCTDEESQELMEVSESLEVFGEDNSRCVMGHVDRKRTALCLPIACAIQEQSLLVKVDGYWKPCSYAGQVISVWWNPNDYVVCPDPSRMCPTFFCPNDCFAEGGNCDYQTGHCMCEAASNVNSTFSPFYTYQRFVPCSPPTLEGHTPHHHFDGIAFNGTHHAVERIDFELPEYYVVNKTMLVDDPRKFDDKVSRMFAQLSAGEVFGLVASFMFCAIFLYIVWSQLLKCHKRRVLLTSLSRARSSVSGTSLSGLLRITSTASLNTIDENGENDDGNMDSPPRRNRGDNPQKDKMVASLLVQMRTQEEQQRRLELGGLTNTSSNDESELKKKGTIADLPPSSEVTLVNRSELPPLPDGGRVLAVVGAHIVEDEGNRHGSVTSATHTSRSLEMSEFQSPLFHDESGGNSLRLRRHME